MMMVLDDLLNHNDAQLMLYQLMRKEIEGFQGELSELSIE
jgi:hypothetical protein